MREAFQLSKLKAPDHRPPTLLQLNRDDDNDCGYCLGAELRPMLLIVAMVLMTMRRMMMAKTKLNAHDDDQGGWGVKLEMK